MKNKKLIKKKLSQALKTLQVETSPFEKVPPPRKQYRGMQSSYKNNSKQKSSIFNWNNKHNGKYTNESNLFQGGTNSDSTRKIAINSQAGKKIILVVSTSKYPDSTKNETLCKKVGTSNKGSKYFRNYEGISNSFSFLTPATAVAKGNSSQAKRKIILVEKIRNLLKKVVLERIYTKKFSAERQFASNLFLAKQKDGQNRSVINLKDLNQYIPHHNFKMESLKSSRTILK